LRTIQVTPRDDENMSANQMMHTITYVKPTHINILDQCGEDFKHNLVL